MTSSLRIATWNLNRPGPSGVERNAAIVAKMAEINADIWVLTETNVCISPGPAYNAWSSPANAPFRRRGERATMIWSRLPIRRSLPTFAGMVLRDDAADPVYPSYSVLGEHASPAVCAEIVTPIGPLLIYGTIITWFGDKGPHEASTYEEEQRRSIPLYSDDWARLAVEGPLCVAGDFNARVCTPTDGIRAETKVTRELINAALSSNKLVCTTESLGYCIDHICLSRTWAERAGPPQQFQQPYKSPQIPVSDHQGVFIDLSLA
ncbi:MAG: endonuclease/exonuclease/phosphatase family protein [Chloroflexales bacterium]|nr:endonuclease/exonuclease/phosphatase family protein [Chloroflexales bacterium]